MVIMSAISNKNPISLWGQIPKRPQDDNKNHKSLGEAYYEILCEKLLDILLLKKKVSFWGLRPFFLNGGVF